jgi:hypothetical protein
MVDSWYITNGIFSSIFYESMKAREISMVESQYKNPDRADVAVEIKPAPLVSSVRLTG